ncbi:glycosyltransferase [Sporomusa acidovorans]|uniref:Uncharacterized protein n=1 Tax=Sporomusa acidovorans (strain ATCC 49682 / DSM 3132 / Mol) TaxID=1123286 RepID=A0ABZ3J7H2_SPOA4|nr:glycosyltransferase [Sporomusa acidovorans]OZC19422.1 chondroitin synthase [Sporomusa acidovorans DSM 3132]SDD76903.1 Glycosyltransferase, catalytic subunit of cellulose synthase and poly-beta-1,6-N-acetylglucosamine synthase [Sporomusa acidovorans]
MDDKKICFIWNVQNEEYYQESAKYIDNLIIPRGFQVDKVVVSNKNYAKAYNQAIAKTNAKYKVYLQDSLFIFNKNFLNDILSILQNPQIGILGILGAKTIPTSGIWQESRHKIGKKYIGNNAKVELVTFNTMKEICEEVKVLDGCIMVTQYDVQWREDIFCSKYYHDVGQCVEFRKKEYKIAVVNQEKPWCLYDNIADDNKAEFERDKEIFLNEYSRDIYPLVSILIPTYNEPEYFKIALESAINQTYRNIEIVVGDDSTDNRTRNLMELYLKKNKNIKYINNNGQLGKYGYNNLKNIYHLSNGEYYNILLHDDIFHPKKIEIMMNYYIELENITLVTSYRQLINEKGEFLPDRAATQKLFDQTTIINGKSLGKFILTNFLNVIGEGTTVLIKKEYTAGMFGVYFDKPYEALGDITQWLELLRKGNAIYISDTLSFFRQHNGQNTNNDYLKIKNAIDSYGYINDSYKHNCFIETENEYKKILSTWLEANSHFMLELSANQTNKLYDEETVHKYLYCINTAKTLLSID